MPQIQDRLGAQRTRVSHSAHSNLRLRSLPGEPFGSLGLYAPGEGGGSPTEEEIRNRARIALINEVYLHSGNRDAQVRSTHPILQLLINVAELPDPRLLQSDAHQDRFGDFLQWTLVTVKHQEVARTRSSCIPARLRVYSA
jgi:hypothetical protein